MSFKMYDLICDNCGLFDESHLFDFRDIPEHEERMKVVESQPCPDCGTIMSRAFVSAPKMGTTKNSPEEWAKMKQSFKERYVKKELNDQRHKFGRMIDESHLGAAVERAKGERKEDE